MAMKSGQAHLVRGILVMKKLIFLAAILAVPTTSAAQELNVQNFSPIAGPHGIYSLEYGRTLGHLDPAVGLVLNYSSRPLAEALPSGRNTIVDQQLAFHFVAGLGITQWMQVDLAFPFYAVNDVVWRGDERSGVTIGDLALRPKFSFFNSEDSMIGLGALIDLSLPTGSAEAFVGAGGVTVTPKILFDVRLGTVTLGANAGVLIQEAKTVQDYEASQQMVFGVGAELAFLEGMVQLGGELTGKSDFSDFLGRAETPVEGLLGAKINIDPGFTIMTAGGAGLTPGVGTPEFRALLGISWTPRDGDYDGDGIPNSRDQCPREAEDFDGFEDEDGCPDPDNDGDGIPDELDQCPNEPEDMDGFEDADGCPDPDNDGDGIPDEEDNCPDEAGPAENGGCPVTDRDGDGIPDDVDQCPDEPEDFDGFQDEDGCPDPDNDNDGIPDAEDNCPNEAGLAEDGGCPAAEQKAVRDGATIRITDRVYFETGKSTIKQESFNLLDQVALVIRSNPDILKLEIAGHTDDIGADEKNLTLSQERAEAVRNFLIEKGIASGRLVAKGYGEARPLTPNRNNASRAMNRRVEFNILEQ